MAWLSGCERQGPERVAGTTTNAAQPSAAAIPAKVAAAGKTNAVAPTLSLEGGEDPVAVMQKAGSAAIAKGDFAAAVDEYKKLIALNPQDEEAHFSLGFTYARLNRTEEAIHHYEECLKLVPGYAEAHNNLGNLLVAKKDFDAGLAHFKKALESQPENSGAQNNIGKVYALQSKVLEAIPFFQAAVQLNPLNYEARYNLGTAYLTTGQYEEAQKELASLVEQNPRMEMARKSLQRVRTILMQRAADQGKPAKP